MDLTIHGTERIQGRTLMRVQDVRSLITQRKTVSLGRKDGYEYLLLYSLPDNDVKIAIVTEDYKDLVTVWERSFRLPRGIKRVTPRSIRKARLIFMFEHKTQKGCRKEWRFSVTLKILVKGKLVCAHECGFMPIRPLYSPEASLPFIKPFLESVVPIIDSCADVDTTQVRYDFWCTHELRLDKYRLKISHEEARKHLGLV